MKSNLIKDFVETWIGRGYEKGEAQPFRIALLREKEIILASVNS